MSDTPAQPGARTRRGRAAPSILMLGALGVVFGDIGTSGLYALQTVFSSDNNDIQATAVDVYGVISLVFWTLVLVVSVEFVILIMRADNEGEGGIMALIALVKKLTIKRPWVKPALVTAGLFGVALFFGDGMITPAISVLSAVEGLEVVSPAMAQWVVPIAVVVLVGLFSFQRFGTSVIGRIFGPVMVLWFVIIAAVGLAQVLKDPNILRAASPLYAADFLLEHPMISFVALGSIVLTITGTEALYADMGHFGRPAITRAWFWIVFPALLLNYAGQGSLILENPAAVKNPFFLLFPSWAQLPMVLLATFATVIASQAVISGAFSVTNQAIRSGYLPRMNIKHTSNTEMGQVYSSAINWALCIAVVGLVLVFRSSTRLASAYGIAVTGTLLIDTLLFLVVMRLLWRRPLWNVILAGAVFLTVNTLFLAANATKIVTGGWFPLGVAVIVFIILSTWYLGNQRVSRQRREREGPLTDFIARLSTMTPPVETVPGTAVHLSLTGTTVPLAMRLGAEQIHVTHEQVIVLSIQPQTEPHVADSESLSVEWLTETTPRIAVLKARVGFRDEISAPHMLEMARDQKLIPDLDPDSVIYIASHITVKPNNEPGMARWRKHLFVSLTKNATSPIEYFELPPERTITLGTEVGV
ncbi:MAG: KUP/HAK/KT family potassium transporter [Actinobacteria bacterium]|nr:KUP/HAK/KT family potassium transporter [Actinomycetota bacterium]